MLKKIHIKDAVGMKLWNDITAMNEGFKGAKFKRGHIIEEKDIEELLNIGKQYIYMGFCKKEIYEEAAAIRLSQMNKIKFAH